MNKILGIDTKGSAFLTTGAAGASTVTFRGINLTLPNILVINNVTRNTIMYNFASSTKGAVSMSNNVLTLDIATTSGYANTDELQVFINVNDLAGISNAEPVAIVDDNDITQEAIIGMWKLLRSVWQMGSAAGAPSFTVRNATAADLLVTATVSGNAGSNITQVNSATVGSVLQNASPESNSTNRALVVAPSQAYHLPIRPASIYSNITI
jgi:hypothetical protein